MIRPDACRTRGSASARPILAAGRADGLDRLHTSLLHEFRHVEQAAERVNGPRDTGAAREPGYGNDPDEFDAYLSEVESSYSTTHMTTAALQAGVGWEFLSAADRTPFQARWTAAQARIRSVLGYPVEDLLRTPGPSGIGSSCARWRAGPAITWERAGRCGTGAAADRGYARGMDEPIDDETFEDWVLEAIDGLPEHVPRAPRLRRDPVEDWPSRGAARASSACPGCTACTRASRARRSTRTTRSIPSRITIYRGPCIRSARTREGVRERVQDTVRHEIAHHFGISRHPAPRARGRARP